MLTRVCQLIEEVVPVAPREYVAESVNLCVHLSIDHSSPAGRRLSGICRVRGYDPSARQWQLEPISHA